MAKENKQPEIETSFLVKSILGVSPIPVIGEIALSSLFYDLLKEGTLDNQFKFFRKA